MTKYFSRLHHHLATAFVLLAAFCATAMEPEIERQLDEQVEKELQAAISVVSMIFLTTEPALHSTLRS